MSEHEVPPLGDVFELMRRVWRIDRGLELVSKRMQDTLGLSAPQRLAIRMIGRFPGITARQLTKILHLDASTVTSLVNRLDKAGLVARRRDPKDRRRIPLVLTPNGRALDAPASGTVEAAMQRVLGEFDERDIATACNVMAAIARALEDEAVPVCEAAATEARVS